VLAAISAEVLGREIRLSPDDLARVLSPEHFVEVRSTLGGPAVSESTRAVARSREQLAADERWREGTDNDLRRAEGNRRTAAASL
jgi:hypothetical protein